MAIGRAQPRICQALEISTEHGQLLFDQQGNFAFGMVLFHW